jgi:AcrR family transcriptional regulator
MSIKGRKKRETALMRDKILAAALRVFAEQGYDRVSMRKIAALIDYSPTTIYRFFKNKEELLQTIAAGTFGGLTAKFDLVKAEGGADPLATLKALVREYMIFCLQHPDMFRMFSAIASFEMEDGVMYERLGATRYKVYQSWFGCIRQSIHAGSLALPDDVRVFLYLWDAVNGYIAHCVRHPRVPRKELAVDAGEYLDLLFAGIEIKNKRTLRGGQDE